MFIENKKPVVGMSWIGHERISTIPIHVLITIIGPYISLTLVRQTLLEFTDDATSLFGYLFIHNYMRIFTSLSNTTSIKKGYACARRENPLNW